MTSELRPAVEVFLDALIAWEDHSDFDYITKSRAVAAIIEADREAVAAYWYRQGKDDGWQMCKENEIDRLREELAEAYIKLSGKSTHASDCATSNAPAMDPGPCNCDAPENSHD